MSQFSDKSYLLRRVVVALAAATLVLAQSEPPTRAPVPTATGPVPVTTDSYPFNAGDKLQTPVDLSAHGYVEQEFFISGKGNVYDWAPDGKITVKASDRPYTTRILVRRPVDPKRFSGTVIAEIAHSARGFDNQVLWGYVGDYIFAHADVYVAITVSSNTIGALKMFNEPRYRDLSFPMPVPNLCDGAAAGRRAGRGGRAGDGGEGAETARRPAQFFPPADDGVKWDIISQVGALLKSNSTTSPLAGLNVEYLFSTDNTASDTATYAKAFAKYARLENGKPVYDGFLIKEGAGPGAVNGCQGRMSQNDPRRTLRNIGVPVMFLVAGNYSARLSTLRREDSDQPGDQFRLYEVPGASHLDRWGTAFLPSLKDQVAAGAERPLTAAAGYDVVCDHQEPLSDFPMPYFVHAMLANLDQWVRNRVPPPRGQRINLENAGTPKAAVVNDMFGNPTGGIRNPFVEVPMATYVSQMAGRGPCDQIGYKIPFGMGKMEALYGNYRSYESKFFAGIDQMVQQRWLLKADAEKLKMEINSQGTR